MSLEVVEALLHVLEDLVGDRLKVNSEFSELSLESDVPDLHIIVYQIVLLEGLEFCKLILQQTSDLNSDFREILIDDSYKPRERRQ